MIRAFNMVCDQANHFSAWHDSGKAYFEQRWPADERQLAKFIQGGEISGDALKKHWFANVEPHVFISHSHKDQLLAMGLAGYLLEMGLEPFVDSLVWGDSNSLIREIDEEFCWVLPQRKHFNYQSRNYSTSHVHMMLASALAETIDRADAVIFLNTPNSIESRSAEIAGADVTASPWIYHELVTTKLIRESGFQGRKWRVASLEHTFDHASVERSVEASVRVLHSPPMEHLTDLSPRQLDQIKRSGLRGLRALDYLYLYSEL